MGATTLAFRRDTCCEIGVQPQYFWTSYYEDLYVDLTPVLPSRNVKVQSDGLGVQRTICDTQMEFQR